MITGIADGEIEFGPPVRRTRTTRKMADKSCYRNAAITVMDPACTGPGSPAWRYAEGMALSPEGWWVHHAWNVDAEGRVLDRTWDEPAVRYVGRVFSAGEVARHILDTDLFGPMRPELPSHYWRPEA